MAGKKRLSPHVLHTAARLPDAVAAGGFSVTIATP
jgi:hypothetical protein